MFRVIAILAIQKMDTFFWKINIPEGINAVILISENSLIVLARDVFIRTIAQKDVSLVMRIQTSRKLSVPLVINNKVINFLRSTKVYVVILEGGNFILMVNVPIPRLTALLVALIAILTPFNNKCTAKNVILSMGTSYLLSAVVIPEMGKGFSMGGLTSVFRLRQIVQKAANSAISS
jgi:hypothetical protein